MTKRPKKPAPRAARAAPKKAAKPARKQASPARAKPKATRTPAALAARHAAFAHAYLTNGHNASAAAAAAGCTGKRLANAGYRLLQHPLVQRLLTARAQAVAELADMNLATWAHELRAIAFSRVGDVFGADDCLAPVPGLPSHVQAAIASVKSTRDGVALEYKFWNKVAALEIMARHLGLFEKDNEQQSDIRVRVELVG